MRSASITGRLSLKEVRLMDTNWKVGSRGLPRIIAAAAVADAAPTRAEVQLHFTFLPMVCGGIYASVSREERDFTALCLEGTRKNENDGVRCVR